MEKIGFLHSFCTAIIVCLGGRRAAKRSLVCRATRTDIDKVLARIFKVVPTPLT